MLCKSYPLKPEALMILLKFPHDLLKEQINISKTVIVLCILNIFIKFYYVCFFIRNFHRIYSCFYTLKKIFFDIMIKIFCQK